MLNRPVPTIVLAAIAIAATFGIGILVAREIARRGAASPAQSVQIYDLGEYAKVAPELLAYRVLVEVPVALQKPTGIASVADGTIYVCGDRSLLEIDRNGAVKAQWDFGSEPSCVAMGPDGTLYVGMTDRVEVVHPGNAAATAWSGLGSKAIVTSIAVTGRDVFVADAGNRKVLRFDAGGKLAGTVGRDYLVPSPFFDVAAGSDGTLWVADPGHHEVQHFASDGTMIAAWGTSSTDIGGFGGCCNPVHLAVLPCGMLVTAEKGLPRVKVYETDGKLTAVVAAPADLPSVESGLDLATRKANGGEVLVLVPSKRVVRVYVKKGVTTGG